MWKERELEFEQLSDEWFAARMGKITGSIVGQIMPGVRGGKPTGYKNLLYKKAIEYLAGVDESDPIPERYANWGHEYEPEALEAVNDLKKWDFKKVGLINSDFNNLVASSPDAMSRGTALEIKCPFYMYSHIKMIDQEPAINLKSDTQSKSYYWQIRHHMLVTGAEWAVFASYHPNFKPKKLHITVIQRDEEEMQKMKDVCNSFIEDMREICRKISR